MSDKSNTPPIPMSTDVAMEAMRKDIHALLAKTQQIHDYLYGSPENDYPARQQIRDQSARILHLEANVVTNEKLDKIITQLTTQLTSLVDRVNKMEEKEKSRQIHTGDATWSILSSVAKIVLGAFMALFVAWIFSGGLTSAQEDSSPTHMKKLDRSPNKTSSLKEPTPSEIPPPTK